MMNKLLGQVNDLNEICHFSVVRDANQLEQSLGQVAKHIIEKSESNEVQR